MLDGAFRSETRLKPAFFVMTNRGRLHWLQRRKSNCMWAYEKMTLLLTQFITSGTSFLMTLWSLKYDVQLQMIKQGIATTACPQISPPAPPSRSKYVRNDKLKLCVSLGSGLVQLAPLLQDFLLFTFWQIGPSAATATCQLGRRAGTIGTLVHTTHHWLPVFFFFISTERSLSLQALSLPRLHSVHWALGSSLEVTNLEPFGEDDYSVVIIQSLGFKPPH